MTNKYDKYSNIVKKSVISVLSVLFSNNAINDISNIDKEKK